MIATEVVDHILGFLHSDQQYTTLETCSVVFPQIVDRHLYSQITFYVPRVFGRPLPRNTSKGTYVVNPTAFSHILIERPHVANYVRVVQIIIESTPALQRVQLPVILEPISRHILSILPRIVSITLSASRSLSWSALATSSARPFETVFTCHRLKKSISNILDFSLDVFGHCKKLRTLLLLGEFVNAESVSTSASHFPRLHSLRVGRYSNSTRIVSWTKPRTHSLQALSFCIQSANTLTIFRPLIEACSNTLTSLELDHLDFCGSDTNPIFPDLQLPHLEHFTFHSHICKPHPEAYHLTIPLLKAFLMSIKNISSLPPIRLTLHFQSRLLGYTSEGIPWSDAAAVLDLPIFRYPIDLHISRQGTGPPLFDVVSSCEQNFDMKRLLRDGKLAIITGEPESDIA